MHVFGYYCQLGAVEFLRKPLSEDKLRNLWQHVVHKVCLDSDHIPLGYDYLTILMLQEEYSHLLSLASAGI